MDLLKCAKNYLRLEAVKTIYTSIVEPHFRSCCLVGVVVEKSCLMLQNCAAPIITNSCYDASSLPLIESLEWLTIKAMIVLKLQLQFINLSMD